MQVEEIYSQNLNTDKIGLQISPKVRSMILWTERGSARHAKMITSDQAWEVFEKLEDFYFNNKSTSTDRTPLRNACDKLAVNNMLVSDAYKLVWEQYGVNDIDQIPANKLPEAVAFVYEMILRLKTTEPQAPLPAEQWQIGAMANTQSYRYLVSIQNDINTISRRLNHMLDLNVQVNESFMAIG